MKENYIFPFLWMRGEEEAVLRKEMEKIHEANIGAVCLEARPHPDFVGEQWWHDFDIVLEEAKKRDMKIWILDDAHFPTGQANGIIPRKYKERARKYLFTQHVDVTGPIPYGTLDVELMQTKKFTWMDFGKTESKPLVDENQLISVVAAKIVKGDLISEEIMDITSKVEDGILHWDVPAGTWRVFVNFTTYDFGAKPDYINYIDKDSVAALIEEVYESHYQKYGEEFGKTISGFFSDEPGFYNIEGFEMNEKIGSKMMPLPWCEELRESMEKQYGEDWHIQIPYLWYPTSEEMLAARIRYNYMDEVTKLYAKNFCGQIGVWCEKHGVEYIGHVIEDNNQHSHLGCGAGHFFRSTSGQHMAGIDNIGQQIVPGNPDVTRHTVAYPADGEFFHFGLAKLGASAAQIDPKKKGRLMCENFGAYGFSLGTKNMKWMVDYLVAQGVNQFVPHAFSMAEYPDVDCPPHFYAGGNNPQFPYFGELMKYTNRLCSVFQNGKNVPQAAILYEGEADWMGKAMRTQVPGRILTEHQIDYEILPADVFAEEEYYQTAVEDGVLTVNGRSMRILIIPELEYLSQEVVDYLEGHEDLPVLFLNSYPKHIMTLKEEKEKLSYLKRYPVVSLEELPERVKNVCGVDACCEKETKHLAVYHYKTERDIYFFMNTSLSETVETEVTLPVVGTWGEYDPWKDVWKEAPVKDSKLSLKLKPYESMILWDCPAETHISNATEEPTAELDISSDWKVTLEEIGYMAEIKECIKMQELIPISVSYPTFSGKMVYEKEVIVDNKSKFTVFEAEHIFEAATLEVNGVPAGVRICPPYRFDITGLLQEGSNNIKLTVVNTAVRNANKKPGIFGIDREILEPSGMFGKIKIS